MQIFISIVVFLMVVGVPAFFAGLFWFSNQEQKDKNNKHVMYWR